MTVINKIKSALERPSTKKYREIKECYDNIDDSTDSGKILKAYYGGWLDSLDYFKSIGAL